MFLKPSRLSSSASQVWHTLAFRLTAGYASAGLLLVLMATLGLYLVLVSELNKSTELFLKDKVNVLRTMLRERPDDADGLHEEVELESAARRYEQFYIRLLDGGGNQLLMTPGMANQLDLSRLGSLLSGHGGSAVPMRGANGKSFRVIEATAPVGNSQDHPITIQVAVDISQKEALLQRFRLWFWVTAAVMLVLFPLSATRLQGRAFGRWKR